MAEMNTINQPIQFNTNQQKNKQLAKYYQKNTKKKLIIVVGITKIA